MEGPFTATTGAAARISACIQTCVIDFDHVRKIREIGVAGVTRPLKAFNDNSQTFSVYEK